MSVIRNNAEATVPVLIVGGGPAGLTAALWLRRSGIEAMLVERRDFATHFPRAHLLNVRTMEIFHDLGAAEDIYAIAAPDGGWQRVAWYTSLAGPTPLHGRKIGDLPAWGGGPDAARYAQASPRRFANLPQLHLDRLLAEHAMAASPGRVHAHQELLGLRIDGPDAIAEIADRQSGERYRVRARYVVAADGGRTTAGLLGVALRGPRALIDVVSLYVRMDLSEYADDTALLTYFVNPDTTAAVPGTLLALSPAPLAKHSPEWTISLKYQIDDPARHDPDAAVAAARRLLGLPDIAMEVKAIGHWQFEGVVADRFRVGPVFLVGDAAHRHPPTGGLGLNTAVQDAANLSWKLAAVLRGHAPESLLDTYERERLPVAAFNVEHALRNAGRHAPIGAALHGGLTGTAGWAEIARWAADTPDGERRRAAVREAVEANRADYGQLNVEAGVRYTSGAVIDDGTREPQGWSPTEYTPSARPGHHIPHAWLHRDEAQMSTVDSVALDGLTLFADDPTGQWREAVARSTRPGGGPLTMVDLSEHGELFGVEPGGAVLVRPDKHVAWRVPRLPADPVNALDAAIRTVLAGGRPEAPAATADRLRTITDAGEALRTA